ncbi:MAG: hypothetical protein KKF00_02905 [Proteobacteria bacterium]|nr:hypothetical protein [Pseudomonadota bacterium]
MGCFLIVSLRDLAQLNSTLKEGISTIDTKSSKYVRIQVGSTAYKSAKEMAEMIRRNVSRAVITSVSSDKQEKAIPTLEKFSHDLEMLYAVSPELSEVYKAEIIHRIEREQRDLDRKQGEIGEEIAAEVLIQTKYLDGTQRVIIPKSRGFDIRGYDRVRNTVIVEVKTGYSGKPFAAMLDTGVYKSDSKDGKGFRQMSNGWLKAVKEERNLEFDLDKVRVLGVHIDPNKQMVSLFRRVDEDATQWKQLMRKPLSDFS